MKNSQVSRTLEPRGKQRGHPQPSLKGDIHQAAPAQYHEQKMAVLHGTFDYGEHTNFTSRL